MTNDVFLAFVSDSVQNDTNIGDAAPDNIDNIDSENSCSVLCKVCIGASGSQQFLLLNAVDILFL